MTTEPDIEKLREEIARALYEHWVAECIEDDWAGWERLGDKDTWFSRADAVLAIPAIEAVRRCGELNSPESQHA